MPPMSGNPAVDDYLARLAEIVQRAVDDLATDVGTTTPSAVTPYGNFVNDESAAAGGVPIGGIYHNGSMLMVRLT